VKLFLPNFSKPIPHLHQMINVKVPIKKYQLALKREAPLKSNFVLTSLIVAN